MENIFFKPFVGANYQRGGIFGKRIMVLGESHYCDEGCDDCGDAARHRDCIDFTTEVINDYLDESKVRERWMNTFLKFERSLVGYETDWNERRRIWQSLLFYNYLQVAMGGPREAGTGEQYKQAAHAFYEVINHYQPQYIIVWGTRLWSQLPDDNRWHEASPISIDDYDVPTGSYSLSNGTRAKAIAVHHPSVGYSWDWWHRAIKEFLR